MDNQIPYIVYGLAVLVLVGSAVFTRQSGSKSIRDLLIWAAIILVGVLGYRVYERMSFTPGMTDDGGYAMRVPYDESSGGYRVLFEANDAEIEGIIDTGATGIALSYEDAEKAGIDVMNLRFNLPIETANGTGYAASATLDRLAFGDVVFYDLPVSVGQEGDLSKSLLGMTLLRRAESFTANGDVMVINF